MMDVEGLMWNRKRMGEAGGWGVADDKEKVKHREWHLCIIFILFPFVFLRAPHTVSGYLFVFGGPSLFVVQADLFIVAASMEQVWVDQCALLNTILLYSVD